MTEYNELINYANLMVDRNIQPIPNNIMNGYDFVAIAYEIGFDNYDVAIKIIRGKVLEEKRRLIGELQMKGVLKPTSFSKTCKCCKQNKNHAEFAQVTDYRTNYQYYNSRCKSCEHNRITSESFKQKKREYYANNLEVSREQSRIRHQRWRERQKQLKYV